MKGTEMTEDEIYNEAQRIKPEIYEMIFNEGYDEAKENYIKRIEELEQENKKIRQKTIENCKTLLENLGHHLAADQLTQLE